MLPAPVCLPSAVDPIRPNVYPFLGPGIRRHVRLSRKTGRKKLAELRPMSNVIYSPFLLLYITCESSGICT